MSTDILHDSAHKRFITTVDGHQAYVEYERQGGVMTITHTIVPSAIGGRGIASDLVRQAMDHARADGLRVEPACSYADAWLRKHPDYADLRN